MKLKFLLFSNAKAIKLILLFVLCGLMNFVFLSVNAQSVKQVSGIIISNDINDFSMCKINLVSLNNDNSKSKKISVNSDGTFCFQISGEKYKLDFDLDSLPSWYGVTKKSIIFDETIDGIVYFELERIDSFDAEIDAGVVNNMFYSSDGRKLFVNHNSNITYNYLNKSIDDIINEGKLSYKIVTNTSFNTYEKTGYIFFDGLDSSKILNRLTEYGIVSSEPNNRDEDLWDYVFDLPTIYYSGNFCIVHESNLNASNHLSNSQLTALVNQLTDIEDYFSDFGFLLPRTINNHLYVYCVYSSSRAAGGYYNTTKSLYLNYNNSFDDFSTLVHEYFHGVQHSYPYVSSKNFLESTAAYATIEYFVDNNLPIDDGEKAFYYEYIGGSGGTLFSNFKPKMYYLFTFFYYVSDQYCSGNGLTYLKNYFLSLSSDTNNVLMELSDFLYLIDSSLDVYNVLINYINVSYPSCRISPDIEDLMEFGVNDEDIIAGTLDYKNFYDEIILPAYGYYIVSINPDDRKCARLTISFEDIQSGLNVSVVTRTNSSTYTTISLTTGNDGSKSCVINKLTGCLIKETGDVQNVYIYISNFTSSSKSLYLNYNKDYIAHNNTIYRIKNLGSGYYMTYNESKNNIYQDVCDYTIENFDYQYFLFKKQNNTYFITTLSATAPTYPLKYISINALDCDTNIELNYSNNPSTYYNFRTQFNQLGYYRIMYGDDGYSVASYDYNIGSNTGNLVNSSGNICLYYDPTMVLSFWEFY